MPNNIKVFVSKINTKGLNKDSLLRLPMSEKDES